MSSSTKRKHDDASSSEQPSKKIKPTKQVKILVCGDVYGKFDKLFSTVNQANKTHGFDVLFCVGKFFSEETEHLHEFSGADSFESLDYLTGKKKISVPTYFIDGGSGNDLVEKNSQGVEICKNLTFLGRSGVTTICGLNVVYLSGLMDPLTYRSVSISGVQTYTDQIIKELEAKIIPGTVDILLTSEWPRDILNHLRDGEYPPSKKIEGEKKFERSSAVSRIAKKAVPKYHFAGLQGVFYERPPYKTVTVDKKVFITRFLGLAPVSDSKEKAAKWLYAAAVTPLSAIKEDQKVPSYVTDSPYEVPSTVQYSSIKKGRIGTKKRQIMRRPRQEKSNLDCWFCLSCPDVEKHLIVSIGEESYLALPKGGLVDDHILIIPIAHAASYLDLTKEAMSEMNRYIEALRSYFAKQKKSIIVFERNIWITKAPQHMHFQVIPIPNSISSDDCKSVFEKEGVLHDFTYLHYDPEVPFDQVIIESGCENSQYLLIELPDKSKLIHQIKDYKLMMNFGRETVAKILKMPDRADWRNCCLSTKEETQLTEDFKKQFAPFDFTL